MIFLKPIEKEINETCYTEDIRAIQQVIIALKNQQLGVTHNSFTTLSIIQAIDESRPEDVYENILMKVEGFFEKNGKRYIFGSGFALNVSDFIKEFYTQLEHTQELESSFKQVPIKIEKPKND